MFSGFPANVNMNLRNPDSLLGREPAAQLVSFCLANEDYGTLVSIKTDLDKFQFNGARLLVEANIDGSDIQIGAVEIKDGTSDTRVVVRSDGAENALVVVQNSQPLPTGAATEATLATRATEATLALIRAKTDNLDAAISSRATEATLATRATEATLATRATEATLALVKAKTDNLDAPISTLATESTLAARASESTLATRASEATLSLIKVKTDNIDTGLSSRAAEATLATRASEATLALVKAKTDNLDTTLSSRAAEATLASRASEATLSLVKAKTDNLDATLSSRATETTLATRASEATLALVKSKTDNLDTTLSSRAAESTLATRASEATLALIKAKTDNLDAPLSGLATEATLASRASEATLSTRASEATLALIKAKTDNLDAAISSRATESTLSSRASEATLLAARTDIGSILAVGATSANQATANTKLTSIDGKLTTTANGLKTDGSEVTQPVSAIALPLPLGAATEATLSGVLTSTNFQTRINTLGQKMMAASTPVTIAIDQAAFPVTITGAGLALDATLTGGTQKTRITDGTNNALVSSAGALIIAGLSAAGSVPSNNPVSVSGVDGGGLKRHILTDTAGRVEINGIAGSVTLPTGASTSANQTTANTLLSSTDAKTPALGQALAAASTPVVLTAAQIATLTPLSTVTANVGTTGGLALDATLTGGAQKTRITDGANNALVSSGGGLIIAGLTAPGVAPVNNPVGVSGVDGGGLKRNILTDAAGRTQVLLNDTAGNGITSVAVAGQRSINTAMVEMAVADADAGNSFKVSTADISAATSGVDNPIFLLKNPALSGKTLYVTFASFDISASAARVQTLKIFEGPTITANGTAATIKNSKFGSATASVATAFTLPTVSAPGSQHYRTSIASGSGQPYHFIEFDGGMVIPPGHNLLITANPSANAIQAAVSISWTER